MSENSFLPPGWVATTLAEVVSPSRLKIQPNADSELPFIGMDSIDPGSLRIGQVQRFADMQSAAGRFLPGDVLYGRMRPYLNKVARPEFEGACSAEFIVFPSTSHLDSRFLAYLLHGRDFVAFASSKSSGDRPRVDLSDIGPFPFPLPPRNEQSRIADKVDELFSDIEEGERALERARKLLDRYRQAVLKDAVTGELTKDWREKRKGEIESGEALLTRILKARREAWEQAELAKMRAKGKELEDDYWKQKYEEPELPQTTNLLRVPSGWAWSTLEMLTDGHEANGISIKGSDSPPGVVALRLDAIRECRVDYTARRYISLEPQRAAKYEVLVGDFLISRANGSKAFLARAALVASNPPTCVFPDTVIRFRPIGLSGLGEWLQAIWPSRMVREQIERMAKTSAGIWKVSQDDLRAVLLPLPPFPEMAATVERLKACQSEVEATDANLRRVSDMGAALRQSILTAAFCGKLVPQDSTDEPASVPLDRIRGERRAAAKPPVKRCGGQSDKPARVAAESELPLA